MRLSTRINHLEEKSGTNKKPVILPFSDPEHMKRSCKADTEIAETLKSSNTIIIYTGVPRALR